jgi:phosphoserine aminotransferase
MGQSIGGCVSRAYNFSPGPAAIPESVLVQAKEQLLEWGQTRSSVMEVSHRGKDFIRLAQESEQDLRDIMSIPEQYKVLFLHGGATSHFALIPMNFAKGQSADYVVTGVWGEKAVREGRCVGDIKLAASSQASGYRSIPARSDWALNKDAAYVHITANETIGGVEFFDTPAVGDVPLVADMSSNILSRPMDVSSYALIYASAQKNIGASGLTVMIVRDDLLQRCPKELPQIFNYTAYAREGSLLNTPNTWGWYLASLIFKWIKQEGGLSVMAQRNAQKAKMLYDYIDQSGFYRNQIDLAVRSQMNVPFQLSDDQLNDVFLKESHEAGLLALKGHSLVGGMRASLYNAMPLAGVQALVSFMRDFAQRNG